MKKRWLLPLILLSAMVFAQSTGCASTYKPKVVILNGVTGLGLARLIGDADYEIEIGKSADVAVARLAAKSADAAALPISTAALLRNKGTPIKLAAITNYGSLYVVSSKKGADLQSIAASFIGVPGRGTMPDVALGMLLPGGAAGVQYYSSPAELSNLLAAGRVESAILPEPWVSQVLRANSALFVAVDIQQKWRAQLGYDYPLSCVVVTESFADERPSELKSLLEDIRSSVEWVTANPKEAASIAAAKLMMDEDAVVAAVPRCNFKYLDGLQARTAAGLFYESVLKAAPAMIGGKLPDEAFYIAF